MAQRKELKKWKSTIQAGNSLRGNIRRKKINKYVKEIKRRYRRFGSLC